MTNIDKQALNQEKIEWLNKLADMEYCKSNPGHWLMSLKDTNMLAKLALRSVALLDELEAAEKRIAEQQSAIIAPGIMRCAGCGFVLTKNSINMAAGTITAGDSKTEPCPNGCGPLWPVTWKEQALQMRDDSEQWFIELQQAKNRIAELEARTVKLPEYRNSPDMHTKQFYEAIGFNQGLDVFIEALRAAGIGVKGE